MAIHATDFQHNVLRQLHNPPHQYAMYVAPLVLKLKDYEKALNVTRSVQSLATDAFRWKRVQIYDPGSAGYLNIGLNPFLRRHISIPPHTTVNTHEHHYSFSPSGGDVAWHGGEVLGDDFRLSNQWLRILNIVYSAEDSGYNRDTFSAFVNEFIESQASELKNGIYFGNNNFWEPVTSFARMLKAYYGIKLMFLERLKE